MTFASNIRCAEAKLGIFAYPPKKVYSRKTSIRGPKVANVQIAFSHEQLLRDARLLPEGRGISNFCANISAKSLLPLENGGLPKQKDEFKLLFRATNQLSAMQLGSAHFEYHLAPYWVTRQVRHPSRHTTQSPSHLYPPACCHPRQ